MLDIRLIRENPDLVREALRQRGDDAALAPILERDRARREAQHRADTLRTELNAASRAFGGLKSLRIRGTQPFREFLAGNPAAEPLLQACGVSDIATLADRSWDEVLSGIQDRLGALSEAVDAAVKAVAEAESRLNDGLLYLPNLPHPSVPPGRGPEDNRVVRTWGQVPSFPFQPKAHWDLGPQLGIIDFDRGVRLAGSRFYVLKGKGAKLQRALIQWMLDVHVNEHGYTEVYPPFLVTEEGMRASGQLPKFADNLYRDVEEDLWLIPTAEVPLTNMHRDEILEPGALPIKYVAYTACFRREKMSAGRDVRGIKRGHQFDKVEMYKFVEPERSLEELESLLADAEDLLQRLKLPYRVVELCAGDLGQSAAKSYDLELWAPGCDEWLEVSSCSTCADYQARRANIRYRLEPGARPRYVHTLNGSGLALPRLLIAVLESYQQPDGSVLVPEALRPYTGWDRIIAP